MGDDLALLLAATFKQIRTVVGYSLSHGIFTNFEVYEKKAVVAWRRTMKFVLVYQMVRNIIYITGNHIRIARHEASFITPIVMGITMV
jgi:hypothetical protein